MTVCNVDLIEEWGGTDIDSPPIPKLNRLYHRHHCGTITTYSYIVVRAVGATVISTIHPSAEENVSSILLIADDRILRDFLRNALEHRGYELMEARTGSEGIAQLVRFTPGIVLVDPTLPDMDGLELLRTIRNRQSCPMIVLSSRDQERAKVASLDAGADDYMTKPIGVEELLARIRAIIRRCTTAQPAATLSTLPRPPLTIGPLTIDSELRSVTRSGTAIHLTPTEFRLLEVLVQNAGRVMPHQELLCAIRGPDCRHDVQHLRVYIASLRRKIEETPAQPTLIQNVSGVGYRFIRPDGTPSPTPSTKPI